MILDRHYNKKLNTASPVVVDFERKSVLVGGNEVITFVEVDNRQRVKANGSGDDWTLNNMLKAGINPATGIHTGNNTRLAGINDLNAFKDVTDKIFEDVSESDSIPEDLPED